MFAAELPHLDVQQRGHDRHERQNEDLIEREELFEDAIRKSVPIDLETRSDKAPQEAADDEAPEMALPGFRSMSQGPYGPGPKAVTPTALIAQQEIISGSIETLDEW